MQTFKRYFIVFLSLLLLTSCTGKSNAGKETNTPSSGTNPDNSKEETHSSPDTASGTVAETEPSASDAEPVSFSWKNGTRELISGNAWAARVFPLPDGRILGGYESPDGIHTRISADLGKNWENDTTASFYPKLSCANINFFRDGTLLYMAYRATGEDPKGYYTSLQISVSDDLGKSWAPHSTVVEYNERTNGIRGVWEPFLGIMNGKLTCVYANDSTYATSQQNIESKYWDGEKWTGRTVICNGIKHDSRDGMPAWIAMHDGGYAMVIESSAHRNDGHPFVIRLLTSENGTKWSEPIDIWVPEHAGAKGAAPGIAELPNGQIVISFQTDEKSPERGDNFSTMHTIISNGKPIRTLTEKDFSTAENVFDTPVGQSSVWTGISYANGILFAAGGTWNGAEMKYVCFPEWIG